MKRILFGFAILFLCLNIYSQTVLDTGDINPGYYFDIGMYNNFGEFLSSPHIFLAFKYGFSRSTEFFTYIDYGRYFKGASAKTGLSVGMGARFALIKEGEFDVPLAAHFKIKGDTDIISGMDLYNIYANVCISYDLLEMLSLKPYTSFGIRYTNAKLYYKDHGHHKMDEQRAFITFGTEYRIDWHYSVFGEITFSDEINVGASFRLNL